MNFKKVFRLRVVSSLIALLIFFLPAHAQAQATALLYNGTGASPTDVVALQNLLASMGLSYNLVNSQQMNSMSRATLLKYKLIVWPGGNSIDMGNSLTAATTNLIRRAVVESGVSYIGFCAGAFMAESSTLYNVFNLAPTWFDFYAQGVTDMVSTLFADGSVRSLVYWDGPYLRGFGSVIAKYPNGLPAIAASKVGKGFVVLTGVHPEAPADWRYGFASPDTDGVTADLSYTQNLINSALYKVMLPHF